MMPAQRVRPAPPPPGQHPKPYAAASPTRLVRMGLGFSIAALIVCLADTLWILGWFDDDSRPTSGAGEFAEAVSQLFILVVGLLLAGAGLIVSLLGIKRASGTSARLRRLGAAGTALSIISLMPPAIVLTLNLAA